MFNLFYAGKVHKGDKQIFKMKAPRLLSFAGDKKEIEYFLEQPERGPMLIDSGAFSVAHSGKTIDIDEYIAYINAHPTIEYWIELDKIPFPILNHETAKDSAEYSWKNYLYMIERLNEPKKLLPVFHIGEDFRHLQNMLEATFNNKHIPYIGLGGTVGLASSVKEDWYKQCFKVIKESNNPNIKTHAFGMTSLDILENYPFTSADSTTWMMLAINGNILTKYGVVGLSNSAQHRPNHILKLPKDVQKQVEAQIAECNLTLEECVENTNLRTVVNIHYIQNWADKYKYKGNNRFQKRLF